MSQSREKCANDILAYCKRNYVIGGPVTSSEGKKKCRQSLKDAGVWGRDKSSRCKTELECEHQGCAEQDESFGSFGNIVSEVAPTLPSNADLVKSKSTNTFNKLKNASFSMFSRQNQGGKRKTRKGKRSKKARKSRKSKKARKSRKR